MLTRFVVDPTAEYAQVLEERSAGGTVSYLLGHERIARREAGQLQYLHADGLGSTRLLTTAAGAAADRWWYQAFGDTELHTGSSANAFLFAGEQQDPNLGWYYLRARYMDPRSGRFTQQDSFAGFDQTPASLHKYLYAHANPVMGTDPSGYMTLSMSMGSLGSMSVLANISTAALGLTMGAIAGKVIVDNLGNRKFNLWDVVAVSQFRAKVGAESEAQSQAVPMDAVIAEEARRGRNEGHHTIPVYLCGSMNQEKKSVINSRDHALIHIQIAAIRVALEGAEQYASKALGRHRQADVLKIAETQQGRTSITQALFYTYFHGGWLGKGVPTIGEAFAKERPMYEDGSNTSLPWCTRSGGPIK